MRHLTISGSARRPVGVALATMLGCVDGDYAPVAPAPPPIVELTIVQLFPSSGPSTGGTVVTVRGSGFDGTTRLHFGESPALVHVVSGRELTAVVPPGAPGEVRVSVSNARGDRRPAPWSFVYVAPGEVDPCYGCWDY